MQKNDNSLDFLIDRLDTIEQREHQDNPDLINIAYSECLMVLDESYFTDDVEAKLNQLKWFITQHYSMMFDDY